MLQHKYRKRVTAGAAKQLYLKNHLEHPPLLSSFIIKMQFSVHYEDNKDKN